MGASARIALWGAAVSLTSAVALAVWAARQGTGLGWSLLGWAAAAAPGLAFGPWLASRHGTPGAGFVVALGASMLVRFVTVLGSLVWALAAGGGALRPWFAGFVAGYVPLQVFELAWFARRGKPWAAFPRG